jgi:hypothetical protein
MWSAAKAAFHFRNFVRLGAGWIVKELHYPVDNVAGLRLSDCVAAVNENARA